MPTKDIQKEVDDANAAEDSTLALLNAIGSGKKKDLSQVLDLEVVQLENGEWAIVSAGPKRMTEKEARWITAAYTALAELGVTDRAKANVKNKGRRKLSYLIPLTALSIGRPAVTRFSPPPLSDSHRAAYSLAGFLARD